MENSDRVLAALDHQPLPFPRHALASSAGVVRISMSAAAADGFTSPAVAHPERRRAHGGRAIRTRKACSFGPKKKKSVNRCGAGPINASLFGRGVGEGLGVHICPTRSTYAALRRGDVIELRIIDVTPGPIRNIPERVFGSNAAAWWGFHYKGLLAGPLSTRSMAPARGLPRSTFPAWYTKPLSCTITENHGIPKNVRWHGTPVPQNPFIAKQTADAARCRAFCGLRPSADGIGATLSKLRGL
jgi:hypothetical protein